MIGSEGLVVFTVGSSDRDCASVQAHSDRK